MKTVSKLCIALFAASTLLTACVVRGGFVIHERPIEPAYYRPEPPFPGAIWIPGEWEWRGNHYAYVNGYYVHPSPRVWVSGHWREVPGGFVWDKGHWRR